MSFKNLISTILALVTFSAITIEVNNQKTAKKWTRLNLPDEHLPYFFNSNKKLKKQCLNDENCPFKDQANITKCWGYENNCKPEDRIFLPKCPGDSKGWTTNKQEQIDLFWKQGDFGYVKERLSEMKTYCAPESPTDSSLECVDHARMCRAKNIYFNFADINCKSSNDRYREDLLKPGQVGGKCKFDSEKFKAQGDHKSPLQSWYAELQHFEQQTENPIETKKCDIVINEPTFLIKLDAGVNMYHHFCDFINLYATQHLNNSFLQNVNIVFWDTSGSDYWSYFSEMWKVFTNKTPIHLRSYEGKKVCFKDAVFSLLARMRFGLYYNMPLIYGCHGTGLFRAFSQHVLHRFNIHQEGPQRDKLRVTFLARGTQFRNILNQEQLVKDMRKRLKNDIELNMVTYDLKTSFIDQLKNTHNSDIFMSMHGAGLTHLLFLPDWAAVFEIHNCEDKDCYNDLARLRGVEYFTWEKEDKVYPQDEGKHPTMGTPHKKFTNYSFDSNEFIRLLKKMINYVTNHPEFVRARRVKHNIKAENEEL